MKRIILFISLFICVELQAHQTTLRFLEDVQSKLHDRVTLLDKKIEELDSDEGIDAFIAESPHFWEAYIRRIIGPIAQAELITAVHRSTCKVASVTSWLFLKHNYMCVDKLINLSIKQATETNNPETLKVLGKNLLHLMDEVSEMTNQAHCNISRALGCLQCANMRSFAHGFSEAEVLQKKYLTMLCCLANRVGLSRIRHPFASREEVVTFLDHIKKTKAHYNPELAQHFFGDDNPVLQQLMEAEKSAYQAAATSTVIAPETRLDLRNLQFNPGQEMEPFLFGLLEEVCFLSDFYWDLKIQHSHLTQLSGFEHTVDTLKDYESFYGLFIEAECEEKRAIEEDPFIAEIKRVDTLKVKATTHKAQSKYEQARIEAIKNHHKIQSKCTYYKEYSEAVSNRYGQKLEALFAHHTATWPQAPQGFVTPETTSESFPKLSKNALRKQKKQAQAVTPVMPTLEAAPVTTPEVVEDKEVNDGSSEWTTYMEEQLKWIEVSRNKKIQQKQDKQAQKTSQEAATGKPLIYQLDRQSLAFLSKIKGETNEDIRENELAHFIHDVNTQYLNGMAQSEAKPKFRPVSENKGGSVFKYWIARGPNATKESHPTYSFTFHRPHGDVVHPGLLRHLKRHLAVAGWF